MKVKDLIKQLNKENPNAVVCVPDFIYFVEIKSYEPIVSKKETHKKYMRTFNGNDIDNHEYSVDYYIPTDRKTKTKNIVVLRTY